MAKQQGFSYVQRKNGDVVISRHGVATILRGRQAQRFLARVATENERELMARFTGNYSRGNER